MRSQHNVGALGQTLAAELDPEWLYLLHSIEGVGIPYSRKALLSSAAYNPIFLGMLLGVKLAADPDFIWPLLAAFTADANYNQMLLNNAPHAARPTSNTTGGPTSKAANTAELLAIIRATSPNGSSQKSTSEP